MKKETIRVAVYERHGKPGEVLQLLEEPWPQPAEDEAIVRMRAAPINPADLNAIEGKYPGQRNVPATPGMEGAGLVAEIGRAVKNLRVGDQVIVPHNYGTWREAGAIKADRLVVCPKEIAPEQAAMLKVNPVTAWLLLHNFVSLGPNEWFIQNAANSGAGRAAIQIGHALGLRSVNIVRRPEVMEELKANGADAVLLESENLREEVKVATEGAPIRLGLNAIGGESALRVMNCLAPDATMVTYGAMSLQPLKIPNGLLIFKNLIVRGLWVTKWYEQATPEMRAQIFARLFELAQRGLLHSPLEKSYSLDEWPAALEHAAREKRSGKILFQL